MKKFLQLILIIILFISIQGCFGKENDEEKDPEFYYQLAMEYIKLGSLEEAVGEFRKALEMDKNHIKTYQMLGTLYMKTGRKKEALNEYKSILSINPKNVTALNFVGVIYTQGKKFGEAEKYFKRALEVNPEDPYTYNNYGLSLAESGELGRAIELYTKSLKKKPKFLRALNNLGFALLKKGLIDEAIYKFNEVLKIDDDNNSAISNLGLAYNKKGELDKAIEYYRKSLESNSKNFYTFLYLAKIYIKKGETEKAEIEFKNALVVNPKFGLAYNGIGFLYAEKGKRLDYAEEMIGKAIKYDSRRKVNYLDSLSWVYYKKKNFKKALSVALEAENLGLKSKKKLSILLKYHLGMIYIKLGENDKGLRYIADFKEREKEKLRKRVQEYGESIVSIDWGKAYQYQSPGFKKQLSSVEYGRRHPDKEGGIVTSFVSAYNIGEIDISDDLTVANVQLIITRGIRGAVVPKPRILKPEKPKIEKWERQNGIWYRTAIPGEVNNTLHLSGALMKRK